MSNGQQAIPSPLTPTAEKKRWPRTVQRHKTSHGLPDPSPPRVGAHADKEREEGHDAESDAELGQVSRAGPLDAKEAVPLVATVADALGEVAAFERRVHVLPIALRVWHPHHLALAAFHEAIFDDESGVQEFPSSVYEPVIDILYEAVVRTEKKERRRYQSVRVIARMF